MIAFHIISYDFQFKACDLKLQQVAFQSNVNHPLAESMGYIKFEGT